MRLSHLAHLMGSLIVSLCFVTAVDAGVTYDLEVKTLNQTYTSTMTLSGSGPSRNISSVSSLFVNGGESTSYSGFSSGQFVWNSTNQTLNINYTVSGTSFTVRLTEVVWPGAVSGGLPEGNVSSWAQNGSGPPRLVIGGGFSFNWNYNNLEYINRGLGGEAPVPGLGGLAALGGVGLIGRRRRR
jgi:hypothetical protein